MGTRGRTLVEVSGLSPFQHLVTRAFFDLPESRGFLLAGGGALLATGLTTRPTNDLDFFGSSQLAPLREVVDGFIAHSERRGWSVTEIQFSDSFARLVVTDDESLVVDIGIDSPAISPVFLSDAGPTFALDELAGRKLLALFDRAEARDFADIYSLHTKFDKSTLLARASELDDGFDEAMFAMMIRTVRRFGPEDFHPGEDEFPAIVRFFSAWADEISGT